MPTLIKDISIIINGVKSDKFKCRIGESEYYASGFKLTRNQAEPNTLEFYLSLAEIIEKDADAAFTPCASVVGTRIEVEAKSETSGFLSLFGEESENLEGTIRFVGLIINVNAARSATHYAVKVIAKSFDHLMTFGKTYRCFVDRTLEDVVREIVENYNGDIEATINPRHTKILPYLVQYNESDYDFLKRLAATYNEWLYCDGEKLVFGDLEIKDEEPTTLKYLSSELADFNAEMKAVNLNQSFISKDYRRGQYSVQHTGEANPDVPENSLIETIVSNCRDLIHKIHQDVIRTITGGNYSEDFDDIRQTEASENEAKRKIAGILKYTGTTYSGRLNIGTALVVQNNRVTNILNGKPLSQTESQEVAITKIEYFWNYDGAFYNTIEGIPDTRSDGSVFPGYKAIMPPRAEMCTATVTDNDDPENLGRIRVSFDWQKAIEREISIPEEETKSPWMQMVHPYGGLNKGFSFIPEIGEEVMVGFMGGNSDKPFVVGTLFDGVGKVDEKWVPDNNSANPIKGIRTRNGHTIEFHDEGDNGYIRIYDYEKENYILTFSTDEKLIKLESTGNIELYAQNDIIMHAGHDINASADNDVFIAAGNDMQRTADNDIREHAGNDRSTSIDRNDSLDVSRNQFIRIDENKDEEVAHKLQITAEDIRTEAKSKLLEYSTIHHMKANAEMALNASARIDIKASQVKTN